MNFVLTRCQNLIHRGRYLNWYLFFYIVRYYKKKKKEKTKIWKNLMISRSTVLLQCNNSHRQCRVILLFFFFFFFMRKTVHFSRTQTYKTLRFFEPEIITLNVWIVVVTSELCIIQLMFSSDFQDEMNWSVESSQNISICM